MTDNTSPSPIGYVTKEDLANLRCGVSCVDLFGSVVPKGAEMIPVYDTPSPLPQVVGGDMRMRMAKAMCERDGFSWDADSVNETGNGETPEQQREYWLDKADAALAALATATEGSGE